MINGDLNDFIDKLTYGDEVLFSYEGKKYFIQGYKKNGICTLYLSQFEPPIDWYIWTCSRESKLQPVDEFLSAQIWDGKTFMEIESEVEWVDE